MILAGVAVGGHLGGFVPLGTIDASDPPPVLLLSLLAFAAGLQNAAVASTTGMSVRTTHLTGPTTDAGMLLGAAVVSSGPGRRSALAGAGLRGGMIFAFMIGAALAVVTAVRAGYLALLVPAVSVLIAGTLSFLPQWSSSDVPFKPEGAAPPPDGKLAGLPKDASPPDEEARKEEADTPTT